MKARFLITCLVAGGLAFGWQTPAHAIGCLSGGLAGAVAGHMAHHGILGAVGGCVAGHTLKKRQQRAAAQDQRDDAYPNRNPNSLQQ